MNVSEFHQRTAEALAGSVGVQFDRTAPLTDARKAMAENTASLDEVNELLEWLTQNHPDALLEKLATRSRALQARRHEIQNCENHHVQKAPLPETDEALKEESLDLQHKRQQFVRSTLAECGGVSQATGLPSKYVRADATEFFRKEMEAAKAGILGLEKPFAGRTNVTPGRRTAAEIKEHQAIVDAWPKTEKMCRLGEKVAAIDARLVEIRNERERIAQEHREAVLAG